VFYKRAARLSPVFNSWLIFPCVGALAVDGIPGPCHLDQAAAGPQTTLTARHSLADYCDEVARPALLLAQKDVEQDILDEGNAKSCAKPLTASSRTLPTNIGLPKEKHMLRSWPQPPNCRCWTGANLALSWRSDAPLVLIGVRAELDEAAAVVLATLAQTHGIGTRMERPEASKAANLAKLDLQEWL
jgi:hypothetical protein